MRIRVQFYSKLREIGGDAELTREINERSTVGEALAGLETEFPELKKWEGRLLLAVGLEFARRGQELQENDLLSIMPPVQGG